MNSGKRDILFMPLVSSEIRASSACSTLKARIERRHHMSSEGRYRFPLFLTALALLAGAGPGAAQNNGDVRAQALDAQGSPIAGIQITLIKAGGKDNQQKTSDAEGKVLF